MSGTIEVSASGPIARITLDRPEAGNSIDVPTAEALRDAADRLCGDPAVKVIVLTGRGRFFCAGGDIRSFANSTDDEAGEIGRITEPLHAAILRLASADKALVTMINGSAAGAGLGLALLGDLAIAGRSAHFTSAYTAIAMSPDAATSWLLPRMIGLRRAQMMVLTNHRVSAQEALDMGLISGLVDDADLEAAVGEAAGRLALLSAHAVGHSRRLLAASFDRSLADHLVDERRGIMNCARTDEGRVAIAAFLDKAT